MKPRKLLGIFLLLTFLPIGQVKADTCSGGSTNFTNPNLVVAKGLYQVENLDGFNMEDIQGDIFSSAYCAELDLMLGEVVLVMDYISPSQQFSSIDIQDELLPGLAVVDLAETGSGTGPAVWRSRNYPASDWQILDFQEPIVASIVEEHVDMMSSDVYHIAYLARVIGSPTTHHQELTVQAGNESEAVSVTINISEPGIMLSNLPARENRIYKDGATWSFGMDLNNMDPDLVYFSGNGFNTDYDPESKSVNVTVNCPDCNEETILTIHAGAVTQDIIFSIDNSPPQGIIDQALQGLLENQLSIVSGSVTDETSVRNGLATFGICKHIPGGSCYDDDSNACSSSNKRVAGNWIDYPTQIESNGRFTINNLPSENGESYTWDLALKDQAGNESSACADTGLYTIQIRQEPYYFTNYSTSPQSPVFSQENLDINFKFTTDIMGCGEDISGVDVFWLKDDEPSSQYPWFREKPGEADCQEWRDVLNPAPDKSCEWNSTWGESPSDPDWCREGWYDYWLANQENLESERIGQISGAGTGFLFNRISLKNYNAESGTYYPLMVIKGIDSSADYLLVGPEFVVQEETELNLQLQEFILNPYLETNSELIPYNPPAGGEACLNESVNRVSTAQKRVVPLFQGKVNPNIIHDEGAMLEIEIFNEREMRKTEQNRVPHAFLRDIPINSDGSFVHAYRLGESAGPFELSDRIEGLEDECFEGEERYTVYFSRIRLSTDLGEASPWIGWYAFRFEYEAMEDEGSSLAAGLLPEREVLADGSESYQANLYVTDKYGNVITHFDNIEPVIEHGEYDVYLDSSLEYSNKEKDSALRIGDIFSKQDYFYTTPLRSLSPTIFSDKKLLIGEGSSAYELDNMAYGLEIPRDLALGAVIKPGSETLHDAQKTQPELMNKDSDCDGYSDGIENTYWTDKLDETSVPGFAEEDCFNPDCKIDGDDSCGIGNEPARFYYNKDGNLVFSAIHNEKGDIDRMQAPSAYFRSPIQVHLEYLLQENDGTYTPATIKDEVWRSHTEGENTYELKLPKVEIFTGAEVRFRIVLENLSQTTNYNLTSNEIDELLHQAFNFVQENSQFGEMEVVDVMRINNSDPINPVVQPVSPSSYSFDTDNTGEFSFGFNSPTNLEIAGGESEIWIDFSVWPSIKNRNLLTSKVLTGGSLQYSNENDPLLKSTVLLSPQLIELYRPTAYPGIISATGDEDERELEIEKIKEEILKRIITATRPWPTQQPVTNFYEKLRNKPVYLGKVVDGKIRLLNNEGKLQDHTGNTLENNSLIGIYGNQTVYAFRDMNIIIGDGEHPVALPETELNLVTVGGNIIIASDLLPVDATAKALGLAALRERVDNSQTTAYYNDPLPESKENEALPGGNMLIDGGVTSILAHTFLEGALFPIDFSTSDLYKNKYLSSLWDFLTENPLNSTYHYESREQNRINQLYIHGLFFSSFNTYGGFKDDRPYTQGTENYSSYNFKLDLGQLRSYVLKEDSNFKCSILLLSLSGKADPSCVDIDTRSFSINSATDYGLPKIFEAGSEIRIGEV